MAPADPPGTVQYDEGRADFPVDEELGLDQGDRSVTVLFVQSLALGVSEVWGCRPY